MVADDYFRSAFEMREIVGILINGTIYTGKEAIARVKYTGDFDDVVCRARLKMMASMDLGHQWEELLRQPTLFYLDEKGKPSWVNETEDKL